VLDAITWVDKDHTDYWEFEQFCNLVKEKSNGQLTIERVGGSEVVPKMQMDMAVRQGVVDLAFAYGSGITDLIPGIEFVYISGVTPQEEEKIGFVDMLRERGEKVGLYFMGRTLVSTGYFTFSTNKKIETRDDFNGLTIAMMGWLSKCLIPLGCTPSAMSSVDYYSAMERGVIDGFLRSPGGTVNFSLFEVSDYLLEQRVMTGALTGLVNMDTWKGLPKNLQDVIKESQQELLPLSEEYQGKIADEAQQKLIDNGMESLKLSPEDTKWYVDTLMGGAWDVMGETYPDLVAKFKGPMLQ